jgi:hypothetical protein
MVFFIVFSVNSTLLGFRFHMTEGRHSGMDCRNPGSMDGSKLAIHGTGYPLPGGYDGLSSNLTQ